MPIFSQGIKSLSETPFGAAFSLPHIKRDVNLNKLVIMEKPSVGKSISAVLGANGREDGCYVGNGYTVF